MVCRMPLGLPGRARGVEDEQRVLGVERPRPRARRLRGRRRRATTGPAVGPRDVLAGAAHDEHVARRSGTRATASSTVGLSARRLAAAVAAVGGDDDPGLGVVDAVGERLGGEAAEDDRVRGADAGAGQHRDDRLGDHRQVDRDPVARADAEVGQGVGGPADLAVQLGVGDGRGCRPGSPSQWMATRSPLPASTCRSTQLYATLSLPPTNHFANGGSDQSRPCATAGPSAAGGPARPRTPAGPWRPGRTSPR